jgi:acyl-homoserine lactone acylase PvdQ
MSRSLQAFALAVLVLLACATPAVAQPPDPGGYQQDDYLGFRNIIPPGQNGFATLPDIFGSITGQFPPHTNDQLAPYATLVYEGANVSAAELDEYFKDASFGVPPQDDLVQENPDCAITAPPSPQSEHCDDVTIVRDGRWGVPHIYGADRAALMFGIGYATAQDRLFTMDVQRHAGRAELSSFLGGSNVGADRAIWRSAPYTDAELEQQFERMDDLYGADGAQAQEDVRNYVDGINQYIAEARQGPDVQQPTSLIPGEYFLIGRPQGPEPWREIDVISVASLVSGIFGKGGGGELRSAQALEAAIARFGEQRGRAVWADFRSAEDPETPTTVQGAEFPYLEPPEEPRGVALPDPGTLRQEPVVAGGPSLRMPVRRSAIGELLTSEGLASNALLVSAAESESGKPLAVMGPQVDYFSPPALMEQDIHAPGGPEGPAIDARGTAFAGANLYVQLGRGPDYAWSATSAGQDIIDTFALPLCEPDSSPPSLGSDHYLYDGECLPFEVIERHNSWEPNQVDNTPSGSETLRALRTKLGIVTHRGRVDGQPVVFTELRATYFHEADSAIGFADFNSPERVASAEDFMAAAAKIDYTFNWFYVDDEDIAYFNSGANPVRAEGTDANLPIWGEPDLVWEGFDPDTFTFQREPASARPQVINQPFITSWNNKQARGYRAADDTFYYGPVHRVQPLNSRIRAHIAGEGRMNLAELVGVMNDAATVDLRGEQVLGLMLRAVRSAKKPLGRKQRRAVKRLVAWRRAGAHRRDRNRDGNYERSAAIRMMDAWWPRFVRAQFRSTLGNALWSRLLAVNGLHDAPGRSGSAFGSGWYSHVHKDLRAILGRPVEGRYSRRYCGGGKRPACVRALRRSLAAALRAKPRDLYPEACLGGSRQWCHDAIRHTAVGAFSQPPIHWVNRPTFQQVVEVQGHR